MEHEQTSRKDIDDMDTGEHSIPQTDLPQQPKRRRLSHELRSLLSPTQHHDHSSGPSSDADQQPTHPPRSQDEVIQPDDPSESSRRPSTSSSSSAPPEKQKLKLRVPDHKLPESVRRYRPKKRSLLRYSLSVQDFDEEGNVIVTTPALAMYRYRFKESAAKVAAEKLQAEQAEKRMMAHRILEAVLRANAEKERAELLLQMNYTREVMPESSEHAVENGVDVDMWDAAMDDKETVVGSEIEGSEDADGQKRLDEEMTVVGSDDENDDVGFVIVGRTELGESSGLQRRARAAKSEDE